LNSHDIPRGLIQIHGKFRNSDVQIGIWAKDRSNEDFYERLEDLESNSLLRGWAVTKDGRRLILMKVEESIKVELPPPPKRKKKGTK
jgi:hypothetical protein